MIFVTTPLPKEMNKEARNTNLLPENKCDYIKRQKSKKWLEQKEDVALAKVYVDVCKDRQRGNQQKSNAFWERVLKHFNA